MFLGLMFILSGICFFGFLALGWVALVRCDKASNSKLAWRWGILAATCYCLSLSSRMIFDIAEKYERSRTIIQLNSYAEGDRYPEIPRYDSRQLFGVRRGEE